jgi:hypothetical protein
MAPKPPTQNREFIRAVKKATFDIRAPNGHINGNDLRRELIRRGLHLDKARCVIERSLRGGEMAEVRSGVFKWV